MDNLVFGKSVYKYLNKTKPNCVCSIYFLDMAKRIVTRIIPSLLKRCIPFLFS